MRRLAVHRRVVRVRGVTLTTIRRTGGIRTVGSRSYMSIVSTTANRTVAVTKGAVRTTRYRAPRVPNRGSIASSVLVTSVRTTRSQTGVRKIKLTRVLGRDRGTVYLNGTVDYCRVRARNKVRVRSVVRMASRTIDR